MTSKHCAIEATLFGQIYCLLFRTNKLLRFKEILFSAATLPTGNATSDFYKLSQPFEV
jgi:hypothetical protein